jgi:nucleoid-associated protein YgaU
VTSVSAKYTLFSAAGVPIRATCTVSLQEMPGEKGKQNPTSGSIAARSLHRVVVGDTLASIAYREYGDPTLWRPLATFNRVDDPLRIPLGSVLMLPSAAELAEPVA